MYRFANAPPRSAGRAAGDDFPPCRTGRRRLKDARRPVALAVNETRGEEAWHAGLAAPARTDVA
ncbi:MAG TPA: hypothetical protein VME43_00085, partial [Bryobacteraceae bacterium]|nr:hypothetical protein [Bryobacteraceae bacterium]